MKRYKLSELAKLLQAELVGEDVEISGVNGLNEAKPGDLTFLDQTRYVPMLQESKAAAVLLAPDLAELAGDRPALLVEQPRLAFAKVLALFAPEWELDEGVHSSAVVEDSAQLGEDVRIGALCYVGKRVKIGPRTRLYPNVVIGDDVEIGADCVVFPLVSIYHQVKIGDRVRIHSGSVLGSDGFGYAPGPEGLVKIPQIGTVIIEDDVEIGSNTSIDRGTTSATIIKRGTKLDNQVQVAHNVKIGRHTVICGQSGVAGSSTVGDGVVIAGQVGVVDHLEVGDGATIGAKAAILTNVPAGVSYTGYPARPHREQLRVWGYESKLPALAKTVAKLEKRLAELEARAAQLAETESEHA